MRRVSSERMNGWIDVENIPTIQNSYFLFNINTYICICTESQSNLLLDEIPKPNNIGEREETGYVGFITLFRLSLVFIYFA